MGSFGCVEWGEDNHLQGQPLAVLPTEQIGRQQNDLVSFGARLCPLREGLVPLGWKSFFLSGPDDMC